MNKITIEEFAQLAKEIARSPSKNKQELNNIVNKLYAVHFPYRNKNNMVKLAFDER